MMTDSSDPSCSQSAESTPPDKTENLKVVVRCRQMKQKEIDAGFENLVEADASKGTVVVKNPRAPESHPDDKKTFTFDTVYDWNSQQSELYEGTFQSVVESVLQGYNGTIFAYGQTGTGKSYIIRGTTTDPALRGVVPRALEQIFQHIQLSKNQQYLVRVSYIQIYQEEVSDLLVGNYGQRCDIKEKPDTGVYIKDLTSVVIKTMGQLDCVLKTGDLNRDRFITHTSPRSSTINYILTVTVECSEVAEDGEKPIRVGRLHFVDMAGSERAARTEAEGLRLKEASKIGLSLSAFGSVISALVDEKSKFIPYRNTKLTRILQDSLGGTAKTVMVACIGPAEYDETVTTLRYANRAKHVKNRPKINVDPKYAVIPVYLEEIERLKAQLTDTASPGIQSLDSKVGENKDEGETNSQSEKSHEDLEDYKRNTEEAIKEKESHLEVTKEDRDALSLKIEAMESMLMTGRAVADQQEVAFKKKKETFHEVLVANTEKIHI